MVEATQSLAGLSPIKGKSLVGRFDGGDLSSDNSLLVLRQVPKHIVLDIDDTFDAVHGNQQFRLFNSFHDVTGFQPIVVFDGEDRFITAALRPAKRPRPSRELHQGLENAPQS